MPRARFAFVAALLVTCASAAVQLSCTLSDEYSSGYGADSGPGVLLPLDASTDASAPQDSSASDVTLITDSGPHDVSVDSAVDVDADEDAYDDGYVDGGPWGDNCSGVPEVIVPEAGATVGTTFQIQVQAPGCIKAMGIYLNSNEIVKGIAGSTYQGSYTVKDAGSYIINVNGWNMTNDAHASEHVTFNVVAD